ncbi:MAG: hypothetical protein ACLPWS_16905 [Rhodomicrobium sp.]
MAAQSFVGSLLLAKRQEGQSQPPLGGIRFETGCHWLRHAPSDFSDPGVREKLDGKYSFNEKEAAAAISWKFMCCDFVAAGFMFATRKD